MWYETARDFFDAALEASRDAERIQQELALMDERAGDVGGPSLSPRTRSTPDPHRAEGRIAARMDHRERLERRQAADYALIDAACEVLYGPDNRGGLAALAGSWVADALWHHYLDGRTWAEVAEAVSYSERHVKERAYAALDLCDAYGMHKIVAGVGGAEG